MALQRIHFMERSETDCKKVNLGLERPFGLALSSAMLGCGVKARVDGAPECVQCMPVNIDKLAVP